MNLEELLNKNNINFVCDENYIMMSCPFCNKTVGGDEFLTLNIETRTGSADCNACKNIFTIDKVLEKLDIKLNYKEKPRSKENDDKENYPSEEIISYQKPKVMSIKEIFSFDFGQEKWLIKGLIPIESPVLIAGHPGNYKSWITQDIARCVASGCDFLGKFEVKQGSVLIVDRENHLRIIKDRLNKLQVSENAPIFYFQSDNFQLDDKKDLDSLLETIKENNIKLIIFDSLIRMHSGDENDAKQISKILDQLKKIIRVGTNVIAIHHLRKENGFQKSSGNSIRGSGDILAFTDVAFVVKKSKEKDVIIIETIKLRTGAEPEPFEVKINDDKEHMSFQYLGETKSSQEDIDEIKDAIVSILEENNIFSTPEIIKNLNNFKSQNIRMALKKLEEEKIINKTTGESNKKSYSLIDTTVK